MKKHVKRSQRKSDKKPLQQRYCNILHRLDLEKFLRFAATRDWHVLGRDDARITIVKYDLREEIYFRTDSKYLDISRHIFPLVAGFYFCHEHYDDDWIRKDGAA